MDIDIIYEDDTILAVNKPAGVAVHEDGRSGDPVLTDWVRATRPEVVGVGEPMRLTNGAVIDRPGVVHRLDRDTSGVLVLAKTQDAFLALKRQFQERLLEKEYRAFAWGELRASHGTIDRPIGRSRKDFRLWSAGRDAGGSMRPATTGWTLLAAKDGFSYVALMPHTGRTHQIRVHLKAVGHPVVCDARYAPGRPPALGFTRLALHARAITFAGLHGERLVLEAPLPADFVSALARLGLA